MAGHGLVQLLSCLESSAVDNLCCHSPWRTDNPRTAGQIRKGLVFILRHVRVRDWWHPTCKKFELPDKRKVNNNDEKLAKAA